MQGAAQRAPGPCAARLRAVERVAPRAAAGHAQPPRRAVARPRLRPLPPRRASHACLALPDDPPPAPAAPVTAAAAAAAAAALPPDGAPPPPPAALPELRSLALALRTLATLRRGAPGLLLLTAASACAEQAIAFGSYALLALLGVPDASYATLAVGVAGICAGYAVGAFGKGAAYVALRDVDAPPATAVPPLPQRAHALLQRSPPPRAVVEAELRRLLSLAWQGFLTFPVPVFAVPKALDLAILMPLLSLERAAGPDAPAADVPRAMARSAALLQGRRRHLLGAVLLLSALFAALLAAGAAALFAAVPSLVTELLPVPLAEFTGPTAGDVFASLAGGEAFARLFETGTDAQRLALSLGLAGGAVLRWGAVAALRCLAYVTWREVAARGPQQRKQHPWLAEMERRVAPWQQKVTGVAQAAANAARRRLGLLKK